MRGTPIWIAVLGLGLGGAAGADPVGFFAALEGDVEVSEAGGSWLAARRDGALAVGDRVRTGEGARTRILLVDDTMLHVDEETEVRIETWHVGDAATRDRSILRHTRGRLRTVVGDAFGTSTRVEVHTPTAVVGVKGTDLETADVSTPAAAGWQACCHGGAITVTTGAGSASPPPGHCVVARAGRAPSEPFPNPRPPLNVSDAPPVPADDFEEVVEIRGLRPPPSRPEGGRLEDDVHGASQPAPPPASRGGPPPVNGPGFSVIP